MRKSLFLLFPVYVLTFIWSITFALYFLNPFHLQEVSTYTLVVLLIGLSMIYLGFFTGKFLSQNFNFQIFDAIANHKIYPFDVKTVRQIVFVFTTISLVGLIGRNILIINAIGGFHDFIINPEFSRKFILEVEGGNIPVNIVLFKIFSYMLSFSFPCVLIGGTLYTIPKQKIISFYPLLVSFLYALFAFQRSNFIGSYIYWLICAFIFIYYHPANSQRNAFKLIIKQVFYFILIFVVFSLLILVIRLFFSGPNAVSFIINSFYFYIAGNIWALDKYLMYDHVPLYGLSSFRTIISWLSAFGLVEKSAILPPNYEFYPLYNMAMNTFSFIRVPYEDFNLFGVAIISYFWGLGAFTAIKAFIKKFTFVRLGFVAMIIFSLFWSFYGFIWIYITPFLWRLFLLGILDYYLTKRHQYFSFN